MTTTKPMLAKSEEELPLGDGWRYEPKWDGFRAIVTRGADGSVKIDSRGDRPLGRYFPELVDLLEKQPSASYVLDGEIVMIANGVMDFETLQLRLHPAASRVNKLAGEIDGILSAAHRFLDPKHIMSALAQRRDDGVRHVFVGEKRAPPV